MLVEVSHTDGLAGLEGGRGASRDCPAPLTVKVTNIRVTAAKVTPRDAKTMLGASLLVHHLFLFRLSTLLASSF